MRNRIRQCFVCLVVFTALFSCSKKETTVAVSGVNLNETEATLEVDGTLTLSATVLPANAVNKAVTWTSDAPEVATVELVLNENGVPTGVVKAIKKGEANIIATTTSGKKSSQCALTVIDKKIPVTDIKIKSEGDVKYVYKGSTLELGTNILPSNATNKEITWTSSKVDVATIDENGVITGLQAGTTEIQATNGEITDKWNIAVRVHVESVSIEPKTGSVLVGKTLQINASLLPDSATDKTLLWSSSSNSCAPVDENGLVTAKVRGNYIITATSNEGRKKATFKINIAAPVNITDDAFKAKLVELGVDKDKDGIINTYEASLVTELDLSGEQGNPSEISDLSTIKSFVNLETLKCKYTKLVSLEIVNEENVDGQTLGNPKLKVLDLEGSYTVENLSCIEVQLTDLNIFGLGALTKLECVGNNCSDFVINRGVIANAGGEPADNEIHALSKLKSINFSDCLGLSKLVIENTGVNKINLDNCSNLNELDCVSNLSLVTLDISDCTEITNLIVSRNVLTSLVLGTCHKLKLLDCRYNKFSEIDISTCNNLNTFVCTSPGRPEDEKLLKTIYVGTSFVKENLASFDVPATANIVKK